MGAEPSRPVSSRGGPGAIRGQGQGSGRRDLDGGALPGLARDARGPGGGAAASSSSAAPFAAAGPTTASSLLGWFQGHTQGALPAVPFERSWDSPLVRAGCGLAFFPWAGRQCD